ncbi:MAG: hypothetical protein VB143_01030 [Burkholderia sp.]
MLSGQLIWWIGVGVLVVAELMTGTFYLLMVAIGFVAGGLVHLAGGAPHVQLAAATLVALVLLVVLRRSRLGSRQKRNASANPGVYAGTPEISVIQTPARPGTRPGRLCCRRSGVPARIVWTRFCNSGGLFEGGCLTGFMG